jgi:phosphate starvation-inducible PhoH-like protein
LTASDVVRHRLVGEIVAAYERYDELQETKSARPRSTS